MKKNTDTSPRPSPHPMRRGSALALIFTFAIFACFARPADAAAPAKEPKSPAAIAEAAAAKSTVSYSQRYRAREFSIATYATLDLESVIGGDAQYGGGVGLDYFITRGLGLGLRAEAQDTKGGFIDQFGPRLTVRAPLWDRVAPYGYVQGIFNLDRDDWRVGTGAGVEWRFTKNLGAFAEAGAEMDLDGRSRLRTAAGLRLSF